DLDVFVVFERRAALKARRHFARIVFHALEGLERAFVDHDAVAQQANLAAALDLAFGDIAAGDLARLGEGKDLADFGVTDDVFLFDRRQQSGEQRFDVVDRVIDDAIITDVDVVALGDVACLGVGADVKADNEGFGRGRQRNVGLVDGADAAVDDADGYFFVAFGQLHQ